MVIRESSYKGRPALLVTTAALDALFLPEDGGKMASLRPAGSDFEFLCQAPGEEYRRLGPEGSYVDSECSAFDDLFPTIDPYAPAEGNLRGIEYPDHGEVCRLIYEVCVAEDGVEFTAASRLLPYAWSKRITEGGDGGLVVRYAVTNTGEEDLPCLWAAHCMLRGEPGARVIAGADPDDEIEVLFSSRPDRYQPGALRRWAGSPSADRLEPHRPDGTTWKYLFARPLRRGLCGCEYPGVGRLLFRYDSKKVPWLEVWLNSGGFQGKYNIALEPCTAPGDSPGEAGRRGHEAILGAGKTLEFDLEINLYE